MMSSFNTTSLLINSGIGTVIGAIAKSRLLAKTKRGNFDNSAPDYFYEGLPVAISAKMQEVYNYNAEVTEHAVENGTPYTDHVILKPVVIELEFECNNFDGLGQNARFAAAALQNMVDVWETRQPFQLITTHKKLDNMVCESFQSTNSADTWGRLSFTARFKQITFVNLLSQGKPMFVVQGAGLNTSAASSPPTASGSTTSSGGPDASKSGGIASNPSQVNMSVVPTSAQLFTPASVNVA
jgi:hypothetical protein